MFFHSLGNEKKLAESIQADYRRSAAGFRRIKAIRTQIKLATKARSAK